MGAHHHPHQPGLIFPSWWNVRQKSAIATLWVYSVVITIHTHIQTEYEHKTLNLPHEECVRVQYVMYCIGGGRLWDGYHRVHTEWQLPTSGVNSIMMEKPALAGEVGGARPSPFATFTITNNDAVYAPAERAIHSPYFISTPKYTLCLWDGNGCRLCIGVHVFTPSYGVPHH